MSRRREALSFNLIGMTENELYDEIDRIENSCISIPSDCDSEADGDESESEGSSAGDAPAALFDHLDVAEIVVSDYGEDEPSSSDEWDAEDTVPLFTLAKRWKSNLVPTWNKCVSNIKTPDPFTADIGLPNFIRHRASLSPYEAFNLLFTDELLSDIVFQTNLYAEQTFQAKGKAYSQTNVDELKTFLGINILMGIKNYPSYRDHWSSVPDLHDPYISKLMRVHRFGWILSNLHLNNNSIMPVHGSANFDKLYKVRPLLDQLKTNFQSCLQPHEKIAVDESMIKFKGRSSLKQYLPKKPIKRGYKVWVLADETGYCWNFDIYTGKTGDQTEKNLGARVVKSLAAPLTNKNHKIYFDNFFSSVKLMEDLLDSKIYACGTINVSRKNLPNFTNDKDLKRGEYEWYTSDSGLTAVKWRDKKSVHMLSNYHVPTIVTEVKRKEKDGSVLLIPCPFLLSDYNRHMNFVDKFDQMRSYYGLDRKSHKWWHRIFFFFLDTTITNAFILYKLYHKENAKLSLKDFRRQVSEGLVAKALVQRIDKIAMSTELLSVIISSHKPTVSTAVRRAESAHQPMRTTRRRCAYCSSKKKDIRTNWQCSICQMPLCLGKTKTCFQCYHPQS